jgi:glycosyltransferase involved in cell wall biosynthesis
VKSVADEIVLVDTGSVDNTKKIAEEYNCKIYNFNWADDFSAARNFALSKTPEGWTLYLDADERLVEKSKGSLEKITSKPGKKGAQCVVNSIDEKNGQPQIMKYVRLFYKSDGIEFEGAAHEQIENSLLRNGYEILDSDVEILHVGYNVPQNELNKKAERNLTLLKKEYEKSGSGYYAYQLANTYSILGKTDEAQAMYKSALKDGALLKEYKVYSYMSAAQFALDEGNITEAESYMRLGFSENSSDALLNLLASKIYMRKNDPRRALEFCRKAAEQNKKLLAGKNYSKILNVIIRPEKVYFHGLYIALVAGDKNSAAFYMNELRGLTGNEIKAAIELFQVLSVGNEIAGNAEEKYINAVTEDNMLCFILFIKNYKHKRQAEKLFRGLREKFSASSRFLGEFGLFLFENGNYIEAEEVLRKSVTGNQKDPASFFYLISCLVQTQKFDSVGEIVELAEKEFAEMPDLLDKIGLIKEKLRALIN